MLKGIDNRLNADVLGCLRAMGHGDVLIIADTNFPADSVARATVTGHLLRMENLTAAEAAQAVLSVLPLDTFVDDFAGRMEIVGDPTTVPPVQAEVQAEIVLHHGIGVFGREMIVIALAGPSLPPRQAGRVVAAVTAVRLAALDAATVGRA